MARRTRVSRGTMRISRSANRKFVWARRLILDAAVPANSAVYSDLLADFQTALGSDAVGVTVTRIRGTWSVTGSRVLIAGARVMTQSTFAGLTGAAFGPATDQYADWMMYQPLMVNQPALTDFWSQDIDVRSSRKLDEIGQGLLLAVSNPTLDAATFDMDLSIGLKLP